MDENMYTDYIPQWVLGNGKINETLFCREFLKTEPMIHTEGAFFKRSGKVTDMSKLRWLIYCSIAPYVHSQVSKRVESILQTMCLVAHRDSLKQEETDIYVANGYYRIGEGFHKELDYCRYRLPVRYNPDAPEPRRWIAFLEELLEPQDITTLQEYMGYCLIPSTRAQKMLMIVGSGGEGKSRIGVVLKALLGDYLFSGSLGKLESNRFAAASLEHRLVYLDDDMQLEALSQTNNIKTIVTAEVPLEIERKGIQSYQAKVCARLIGFGNGSLKALHDRSHGFFRRQIILTTKPRPKDRMDDPYLADALLQEKEGILRWCIDGLISLHYSGYRFCLSDQAELNLKEAVSEGNNIVDFLESRDYIRFDPQGSITSRGLYRIYQDWCGDNLLQPLTARTFSGWLKDNAQHYALVYRWDIRGPGGKPARGFQGIRSCSGLE